MHALLELGRVGKEGGNRPPQHYRSDKKNRKLCKKKNWFGKVIIAVHNPVNLQEEEENKKGTRKLIATNQINVPMSWLNVS